VSVTESGDAPDQGLRGIKQRLSPRLLAVPGVAGVGIPGGTLTVYLAEDDPEIREHVASIVAAEAPGTPVAFVVTGEFRPH